MKVVYICHPYENDPEGNTEKVTKIIDEIFKAGSAAFKDHGEPDYSNPCRRQEQIIVPLSTFHAFTKTMKQSDKFPRKLVMKYCTALLQRCHQCWVYSSDGVTDGMKEEIEFCSTHNIPVVFKS